MSPTASKDGPRIIDLSEEIVDLALYAHNDIRKLRLKCVSGATLVEVGSTIEFEIVGIERTVWEL